MNSADIDLQLSERLNRVRTLNTSDIEALNELMEPQLTILEKKGVITKPFKDRLYNYLDNEKYPGQFLFGYFTETGQLNCIIGLYFWKLMPFATLSYMFLRKNNQLFNANKNGLNLCLHKCFQTSESRGVTTFFSLQKSKSYKHKIRTWRREDTDITKKYFSIPQAVIKAGSLSEFSVIRDLMDHQTWPYDTTLWMTTLKPEYQKIVNWGEGLSLFS